MKKRVLSLFMALALCFSMAPEVSFAEEAGAVTEQEAQNGGSTADGYTTGDETPGDDIIGNDVSGGDVSDGDTNAEVQDAEKDAAVLSVQEQMNALPDVDALSTMEEDEVLAAYMAIQEAYDAYDALTAEQQAQIMGADRFEELFGWFNGQIVPLDDYLNIEYGVVNEETGERKPWSVKRTGYIIVNAGMTVWEVADYSYYVLEEDVDLSSLTVQGNKAAYLYLGKDTTLTINGPITFRNGGCLFVYGASDGSGKVIINNTSDSAAIQAEGESNGSYLAVCGGTLEITSTSGRITDGVYLVNGNDSYHYMEYTIDDKAVVYDENKEMLEGKTITGTQCTLTWCEHDNAKDVPSDGTHHQMKCAQCGFVGTAVACEFDNPDSYDPGDANGHYAKCFCGNVDTTNQLEHQFETMPTDNGQYHTSRCGYCNYIEGGAEQEAHIWDTAEGECKVCSFMPVAQDSLGNLYDGGTQTGVKTALKAVADGNGAEYVELYSKKADDKGITENVEFEHPGKTVELRMNGYTLQANGNPTLRVTDGTLNITGDATIKSIGQSQETAGYAISVSGGKLIFEGNLNAEGGLHDKTRRSAVIANGGELEFKGDLNLNGGLTLTGDAKLTDGLTQGTFQAEGDTSARVSVEGSKVYSNVQGLLAEDYAFVDKNDTSVFVDASAKTLAQDVTIVAHKHNYQPMEGSGDYQCTACGLICSHDGGFSSGACAVCHKPCPHTNATKSKEDNQYYCNACETAMLVQIEKDGKTWFGADFRAAMCEAEDGTKITLLADVVMSGWSKAKISGDNKVVTLDLNGHNITGRGGIYVGKNDNSATCRLNIMGAGSIETVTIDLKGTLDLSGWTGGTIRDLNISDSSTYPENEREAGLIVGSKASTIQTLSFGNNQLSKREKIKLSGGSYGEISELGFTAVKLGDLLEAGYAFQKANETYVNYEQTINRAAIYNVKVVKCPHEKVGEDGTCVYCNKTGIAATLDGEAYSDVNTAVTDWLSKGGVLKLCTDYSGSIDFSSATNPLTIDLNGHSFNQGKEMSLSGANLTIRDTAETGKNEFGRLEADNGTLILEGGTLEVLNAPENSLAAISLRGGQFTAGVISGDVYKMLADGYYLLHDTDPINPVKSVDAPSSGEFYQVKKADITADGEKSGTITFGENRVPIGANVSVGEDGITHVQFGWYAVTDNGYVAQLAESEDVELSDVRVASYEPTAEDCEAYTTGWYGLYGGETYELLCVVAGKDSNNSTQWQTVLKGYQLGVEQASLDSEKTVITQQANSGNTGNKADNRLVVTPNADGGFDDVTYKFDVRYDGKMLTRGTDYTIKDGNTAKNAGEHTLIIEGAGNYTGEKTVTWTIEPYELSKELVFTQVTKEYDGAATADENTTGVADLGVFKIDSSNLRNPAVQNDSIDLKTSVDKTDLHFDSAEAGSRTFSFTLTLTDNNFVFADGEKAAEFELSGAKAAISQKTIEAPAAKDLSVINGHAATYTVDLAEMLPKLASPMEYGSVQYSIDSVILDSDYYTTGNTGNQAYVEEDGKLKLPVLKSTKTGDVYVGSITVKVISDNVKEFILTINVTARDKIVPTLDGTLTLDPAEITYGDKLSKITTISGTMKDGNEEVPGTFAWKNPDAVLNAGTHDVTWIFTPTDNMNYAVATGTVTVKVNQAEQGGTVSMISYTYNAAPNTPTLTGRTGDSSATVTYYYSTTDTNEGGTEWKNIDSTTLDAETYYMYAVIGATENYKEFTTPAVRFVVWKAAPEYTEPTGVTAKYGQMLGEITLTNPEGNMDGKWSWEAPATIPNKTGEALYNVGFKPTSENYKEVTEIAINVTVVKGDGKNLATDELTQKFTDSSEHTYTPDWSGLPAGQTWSYSCASSVSNGSAAKLTTKVSAENGELTYAVSGGEVGDTITVTLKASCENYKDFTVTLNITLTEKDNQKPLTITGSNIGVYGQTMKLGTTGGSGTGKVTYSIEAGSEGEATIDADGVLTPVKAGYIVVRATKAADAEYNEITSDRFEILITQAPTTGEPRYTKITTGGKTLADAGLTLEGGTLNPAEGKLEWIDFEGDTLPNDTEVEVNAIYTWCFTPKDTNYAHLTGDVVLYYVEAPAISAQPKDASVKAGEKAVFEVTATGTDLTYQWQIDRNDGKGFVNLNGATGASYTSGVTDMDCNGFKYQCIISNVAGSVTTETVTLTVTVYYTITATAGEHGSISPSGAVEVAEGSNQTFTITADAGYEIESLKVDGTEVSVAASYTFETVKAAHTIEVTFKVVVYEIIGGADSSWTQNVDGSLAIRGNGEIADFQKVLVDGNVVDPENYIVTEGSTIITLKPEFLSTLSEGSHTFEIVWTNGSAGTSFTVAKNTSGNNGGNNNGNNNSNNNSNNSSNNNSSDNAGSSDGTADKTVIAPKTGDDSLDALLVVFVVVAFAGLAGVLVLKKKNTYK